MNTNQEETPQVARLRRLATLIQAARQTVILQTQEGTGPLAAMVAWMHQLEAQHELLAVQYEEVQKAAVMATVVKLTADVEAMHAIIGQNEQPEPETPPDPGEAE